MSLLIGWTAVLVRMRFSKKLVEGTLLHSQTNAELSLSKRMPKTYASWQAMSSEMTTMIVRSCVRECVGARVREYVHARQPATHQ